MTSSWALPAFACILAVQVAVGVAVWAAGRHADRLRRLLPFLVSGAAGVLLGTACLDLLPEAVRAGGTGTGVWGALLLTLLLLFLMDTLAYALSATSQHADTAAPAHDDSPIWSRGLNTGSHLPVGKPKQGEPARARTTSLLLGSSLHSAVDGIAIAAAFAAGWRPGISAAIAVALHELPHRLGDFSLLHHRGLCRRKAAQLSIAAGAAAFAGGLAVVVLGQRAQAAHWLLPVSAGSFLYIALVDLVPEVQAHRQSTRIWWEVVCLVAGAGLIAAAIFVMGE